jgi:hypothetical protein
MKRILILLTLVLMIGAVFGVPNVGQFVPEFTHEDAEIDQAVDQVDSLLTIISLSDSTAVFDSVYSRIISAGTFEGIQADKINDADEDTYVQAVEDSILFYIADILKAYINSNGFTASGSFSADTLSADQLTLAEQLILATAKKILLEGSGSDTYIHSPSSDIVDIVVGGVIFRIAEDGDITVSIDGVNFYSADTSEDTFQLLGDLELQFPLELLEDAVTVLANSDIDSAADGTEVGSQITVDDVAVLEAVGESDGSAADRYIIRHNSFNGSSYQQCSISEEVTIAVGDGSDPVVTTTGNLAPANCLIKGIAFRVTDAPGGGATTLDIGITGGDLDAYIDGASCDVLGETGDFYTNGSVSAPIINRGAATTLTLTTDADVTDDEMKVRVIVWYEDITAPTN